MSANHEKVEALFNEALNKRESEKRPAFPDAVCEASHSGAVLYDAVSMERRKVLDGTMGSIFSLTFSPDSRIVPVFSPKPVRVTTNCRSAWSRC